MTRTVDSNVMVEVLIIVLTLYQPNSQRVLEVDCHQLEQHDNQYAPTLSQHIDGVSPDTLIDTRSRSEPTMSANTL